jgi:hypothetical protein
MIYMSLHFPPYRALTMFHHLGLKLLTQVSSYFRHLAFLSSSLAFRLCFTRDNPFYVPQKRHDLQTDFDFAATNRNPDRTDYQKTIPDILIRISLSDFRSSSYADQHRTERLFTGRQ